mgnify:CR=1 FL=1
MLGAKERWIRIRKNVLFSSANQDLDQATVGVHLDAYIYSTDPDPDRDSLFKFIALNIT